MSPEKENKVYMIIFAILAAAFLVMVVRLSLLSITGASSVNISDIVVSLSLVGAILSAAAFYLSWTDGKALKKQKKRGG